MSALRAPGAEVVLLVPGLRALDPALFAPEELASAGALLMHFLNRAEVAPGPSGLNEILAGCGESPATLAYRADTGRAAPGPLLRADPVHLRADMEAVHLYGPEMLKIGADEATALVAAFNALYAEDGLRLEAPHPQRWYLHLDGPALPRTRPLASVRGTAVGHRWIEDDPSGFWLRMLNEVQMLLYAQPVNRTREADRRPVINGLWPWGGETLAGSPRWALPGGVDSADPVLRGWAQASGRRLDSGAGLVHLDAIENGLAYGDAAGLLEAVQVVGRRLQPLGRTAVLWPLDGHAYRIGGWRPLLPRRTALADWLRG